MRLMVDGPFNYQAETASGLAMGALGVRWSGNGDYQGTAAVGLMKEEDVMGWAGEPVHWQLHMGCGKKRGVLRLFTLSV